MHHSLGEVVVALGDVETSHAQLLDVVQGWLQARLVNDAKGCLIASDLALQRKDLQSGLSDLPSFVKHLKQNGVSVSDLIQQYNGTVAEEWQVPVPESVVIASAGGRVAHIDDSFKCKSKASLAEVTQDESPTCDFQDGPQEARKDVPKDSLPESFKSPEHAHDDSIKAGLDKSEFGSVTIKEPHDLIASVMDQQKPTLNEQEWPVLALTLKQADQANDDQVADDYADEPAREKQPGSDHIVVDDQARAIPNEGLRCASQASTRRAGVANPPVAAPQKGSQTVDGNDDTQEPAPKKCSESGGDQTIPEGQPQFGD